MPSGTAVTAGELTTLRPGGRKAVSGVVKNAAFWRIAYFAFAVLYVAAVTYGAIKATRRGS
jgi:anti-sigma-K factor RskA